MLQVGKESQTQEEKLGILRKLMRRENFRKLTPVDVAGNQGNFDTLKILLKYFNRNELILAEIFKIFDKESKNNCEEYDKNSKFKIKIFKD